MVNNLREDVNKHPKTLGDKFFNCLTLLAPVIENFKAIDRKLPKMQDGSSFLKSDELSRIGDIISKIVKHYHANKTVSFSFTQSYINKIVTLLDQYVDSLKEKENVSDLLDKLLAELYQTVYQIRKELRYA